MADESTEPAMLTLNGREIRLTSGAKVFGALHEGRSAVWKFTSTKGAVTEVTLSIEAMSAVVQLYQGMIGCDPGFAAVGFDPLSDSASAEGKP